MLRPRVDVLAWASWRVDGEDVEDVEETAASGIYRGGDELASLQQL